jgi:hypothetical protein
MVLIIWAHSARSDSEPFTYTSAAVLPFLFPPPSSISESAARLPPHLCSTYKSAASDRSAPASYSLGLVLCALRKRKKEKYQKKKNPHLTKK